MKNAVINEALNIALDRLGFEELDELIMENGKWKIEESPVGDDVKSECDSAHHNYPLSTIPYQLYRKAKALLDKASPGYDPQAAIPLLIQSAEQGYEWTQYTLGKMFLQGNGVPQDVDYGLKWLWKAEDQHNEYAQILLARTYLKGELVEPDISIAKILLEKAADAGMGFLRATPTRSTRWRNCTSAVRRRIPPSRGR